MNGAGGKAKKAARTECEQGRKWIVENHEGNQSIIIDDTSPKQTLYIYKCTGCTIQVRFGSTMEAYQTIGSRPDMLAVSIWSEPCICCLNLSDSLEGCPNRMTKPDGY